MITYGTLVTLLPTFAPYPETSQPIIEPGVPKMSTSANMPVGFNATAMTLTRISSSSMAGMGTFTTAVLPDSWITTAFIMLWEDDIL
ncbi:hypothetical protein BC629DRAFT_286373 [Irpex lacteus]|nr:hypothetical protein BC629DRAFT_286373 [Irpex lacteus]